MISCPEPKLIRSQKTCGGRERGAGKERKDTGGTWDNWGPGREVAASRKMRTYQLADRDRRMKKVRRRWWRRVKRW